MTQPSEQAISKSKAWPSITRLYDKRLLIPVLIVLGCVFRFPSDDFRMSMTVVFKVAVCLLLALKIWEQSRWLASILLLALFSSYYPFYTKDSFLAFDNLFYGSIAFYIILRCSNTEHLLNAICIIALLNILMIFLQSVGMDPIFKAIKGGPSPPVGFLGNTNLASALIAFCLPAFLRGKWTYFIPLLIMGFILTTSYGGVAAVIIGLIFYFSAIKHKGFDNIFKRFLVCFVLILLAVVYWIAVDKPNTWDRYIAYKTTLILFSQHWIAGSGLGHWPTVLNHNIAFIQDTKEVWNHAHNDILELTFDMGFMFPVLLTGYIISVYRRYHKKAILGATALVVILTNAMFNFPFFIAPTAMLTIVWVTILEKQLSEGMA